MPALVRCAVRGCSATIKLPMSYDVYGGRDPFVHPEPIANTPRTGWKCLRHGEPYYCFCPTHYREEGTKLSVRRRDHNEAQRQAAEAWLVSNPAPVPDWRPSWEPKP
jgi:hypothetical protein